MAGKVTWVVVADGARAHFFASEEGTLRPALDHDVVASTRSPGRDAESDRPGRSFESANTARHAMEPPTDWKTKERQRLAQNVADELLSAATRKVFDRLVVAAPPEMLGDLRGAMDAQVARLVVAEIDKDLTHFKAHQLRDHLGEALRG